MIETLQARSAFFRSLRDPVDTASPQGLFTLQVLGAAAQLERELIRERTRSGMRAAAARGKRADLDREVAGTRSVAVRAKNLAGLYSRRRHDA